jgi:hypothetical protein
MELIAKIRQVIVSRVERERPRQPVGAPQLGRSFRLSWRKPKGLNGPNLADLVAEAADHEQVLDLAAGWEVIG